MDGVHFLVLVAFNFPPSGQILCTIFKNFDRIKEKKKYVNYDSYDKSSTSQLQHSLGVSFQDTNIDRSSGELGIRGEKESFIILEYKCFVCVLLTSDFHLSSCFDTDTITALTLNLNDSSNEICVAFLK